MLVSVSKWWANLYKHVNIFTTLPFHLVSTWDSGAFLRNLNEKGISWCAWLVPQAWGGRGFSFFPPPPLCGLWRPKILDLSECEGYYSPHAILRYSLPQNNFFLGEWVVESILDVQICKVEGELDLILWSSIRDLELNHYWSLRSCTIIVHLFFRFDR